MSRPHCWICGSRLMYINGAPVYATIIDPIGVEHHAHKDCAKYQKMEDEEQRRKDFNEFANETKP